MNIIERGYCLFAAPTHYIPKTRPELLMKSVIERGGKQEDYVAGLEGTTRPPTCRMGHDLFLTNQVVYCDPVHQMSPLNQLKNICYSTKLVSQLDVTGCYHSFFIDSMSKQLSGFESGITHRSIPKSRKEMKSFLGALVFFSQIAPIAVEEIAILHKSTRGEF